MLHFWVSLIDSFLCNAIPIVYYVLTIFILYSILLFTTSIKNIFAPLQKIYSLQFFYKIVFYLAYII